MTRIKLNDTFRQFYPNDPLHGYFLLGGVGEWLAENVSDPTEVAHRADLDDIDRPVYVEFKNPATAQAFREAFPNAVQNQQNIPKTP